MSSDGYNEILLQLEKIHSYGYFIYLNCKFLNVSIMDRDIIGFLQEFFKSRIFIGVYNMKTAFAEYIYFIVSNSIMKYLYNTTELRTEN